MSADIGSFQNQDKRMVKMQVVQSRMPYLHLPALWEMLVSGLQLVSFGSILEANIQKAFNSRAWTPLLDRR